MLRVIQYIISIVVAGVIVMAEVGNDPSQNIAWWFDQCGWRQAGIWIRLHGPHLIGPLFIPALFLICAACLFWPILVFGYRRLWLGPVSESGTPNMPIHEVIDYIVNDSCADLRDQPVGYDNNLASKVNWRGEQHNDALE
jgi:hypothetical protein